MIRSSRSRWLSGVGAVVLIGGLVLANYGSGVPPAEANITLVNPFPIIIDKLNQILAKLSLSGGGGNHTLRWDTYNAVATRFTTTGYAGAVLDNSTGLVWEQWPDITGGDFANGTRTWSDATLHCVNRNVGGSVGWRLPSVVELKSVQEPTHGSPFVPASVFPNVQSVSYWSATTNADYPAAAWVVIFTNGYVDIAIKSYPKQVWCVRGGMNADVY